MISFVLRRLSLATTVRLTRTLPVAAFLLVAAAAGRAEAGCDDWPIGHEATAHSQIADHSDAPPPPCDGPLCRRDREGAPAVPHGPNRQLDQSERWCRLAQEFASRPPVSSPLPPEAAPSLAQGFTPRVDRPPRV